MSTQPEDSITTPPSEEELEAEAAAAFAEAVEAREGKSAEASADAPGADTTATTQEGQSGEATTAGAGESQSGGSEGEAAPAAAASGEGDIWANAPPELKAAYEAAEDARKKAEQQFRSREGREAALQRQLAELRQGGQEEQPRKPLKDLLAKDKVEELTRDYPDLAPVLSTLSEAIERLDGVEQVVGETRSVAATALAAPEERELTRAVPNWIDLAQHDAFQSWVDDQPKTVRQTVADNWNAITNATEAAKVFKAFEEHIKPPEKTETTGSGGAPAKRERQAAGARAATVNAPTSAGGESDDEEVAFAQAAKKVDARRGLRT